jgi:transcriptional regulator with PAS, ATPase and Fis domain
VRALEAHDWPGNVRELQHAIERATILADDEPTILPEHLSLAS